MILASETCSCPISDSGLSVDNSPICSTALFMILLEGYLRGRCDISTPCENVQSADELQSEYDFIVVGAGPAGSVVAGRLSEGGQHNVLLLEAGIEEPVAARIPSFYRSFQGNEVVDWRYTTVPADYCGGSGCSWIRGKVVGGSNVLNGMMYHKGHAADYDEWVDFGAKGWSWEENQEYFNRNEGNKQVGSLVSELYHSANGTLPVEQFPYQPPFLFEMLNAINETGLPIIQDMNDPTTPEGFVIAQTMSYNGQRVTAARAYLKPQSERPNLTLKTQAHVSRVLIEDNKAVGVEYIDSDGNTNTVTATKEVILSAGALNSPHILLLSGIGPKETLDQFNISVVADLPVGKNLRNHVGVPLFFLITKQNNTEVLDWSVLSQYLLTRKGPMSSTALTQLTGLLYSSLANQTLQQPDIQFFFSGFIAECSKTGVIDEPVCTDDCLVNGRNLLADATLLKPRSAGYLTLNSTDPLVQPIFDPNYFSDPEDMVMLKDGVKYLQQIFESETLKTKWGVKLDPDYSVDGDDEEWSDEWVEKMVLKYTDAQNHQQGTAAMGWVVDPELKVYGVEGLRVIDASVMPTQVTGNPQGAIMMVAERGAANLLSDWA